MTIFTQIEKNIMIKYLEVYGYEKFRHHINRNRAD